MSRIFVSGLSNVETSCAIESFPIEYQPVDYNFFGVKSIASGVGLNVALALTSLGDTVSFATFAADDDVGALVRLTAEPINDCRFAPCKETPQSVVLYDKDGRRRVYTDLKDMQELRLSEDDYADLDGFDGFCLCNINYSRPLLGIAKATGKPIFCDVHCLSDVYDDYNADFMRAADVLFLSNEKIIGREREFVKELAAVYPCRYIIVGMGDKGALLYGRKCERFSAVPAVKTREIKNTVGAGDALFSAFVHFFLQGEEPVEALRKASYFASYKIGESGASKGFLTEPELLKLT
ncbi:MAG: carbohydrate kinase family protein [Ruminococcus sp.]|uniref:carbohydrate kinase family protein n=1 Tax=Ruminococcus sp. TaxID=41978 RepID=UPI00287375E8|nr:carbohydrate kinase family protein [Ruminococcus sp.]MBQ3284513.1 carbohydrate kinase family protein [Ruminococcus sp.]